MTPEKPAKRQRLRKSANWFLPIRETTETLASSRASLKRSAASIQTVISNMRAAWANRAKSIESDSDASIIASANLAAIPAEDRALIQRQTRRTWAIGVTMIVIGVVWNIVTALATHTFWTVLMSGLFVLTWTGFGVATALRALVDYHAVTTQHPVSGMHILRNPTLWLPRHRHQ